MTGDKQTLIFTIAGLILFLGGVYGAFDSYNTASNNLQRASSLSEDMKDGSIDNYSRTEAQNIIDDLGSRSTFNFPALFFLYSVIAGFGGLVFFTQYKELDVNKD